MITSASYTSKTKHTHTFSSKSVYTKQAAENFRVISLAAATSKANFKQGVWEA